MKNEITIYYGCYEHKEKITLYDFEKVDHTTINGKAYLRILCDSKFYYYELQITSIGEIIIYK